MDAVRRVAGRQHGLITRDQAEQIGIGPAGVVLGTGQRPARRRRPPRGRAPRLTPLARAADPRRRALGRSGGDGVPPIRRAPVGRGGHAVRHRSTSPSPSEPARRPSRGSASTRRPTSRICGRSAVPGSPRRTRSGSWSTSARSRPRPCRGHSRASCSTASSRGRRSRRPFVGTAGRAAMASSSCEPPSPRGTSKAARPTACSSSGCPPCWPRTACRPPRSTPASSATRSTSPLEHARVVLECDGWDTHGRDRRQFERDRARDATLIAAGWVVLRFTWIQITRRPAWVASIIRRTVVTRRRARE